MANRTDDITMPGDLPDFHRMTNEEVLEEYDTASHWTEGAFTVKQNRAWKKRRDEMKRVILERMGD